MDQQKVSQQRGPVSYKYKTRATRFIAKKYYFLDTNVIVNYMNKVSDVVSFVDNPNNEFLYTETVLLELRMPRAKISQRFRFIDSNLSVERKMNAIDLLDKRWHEEFDVKFGLTQRQLQRFRNDLFIIFEASFCRYKRGVSADTDLRSPILLTYNMVLYNKFLLLARAEHILDDVIGLAGFESLIPIDTMRYTLSKWQLS